MSPDQSAPTPWTAKNCGIYDAKGALIAATGDDGLHDGGQVERATLIAAAVNAHQRNADTIADLTAALRFYADGNSWNIPGSHHFSSIEKDKGDRARAALAKVEKP